MTSITDRCMTDEREANGFPITYCTTHGQDSSRCPVTEEEPSTEEVLAATSSEGLLTTYAALTHRLHATERPRRAPGLTVLQSDTLTDLRAQRDLVAAEILRRMG